MVIEAVQWDGISTTANSFIGEAFGVDWDYESKESSAIIIPTLEGRMKGEVGDWIIKGVKGEFYPIKDTIFKETYEKVD